MQLEIISPEKRIYSGEVVLVQLPGTQGSFEILNHHAPIISTLEKGQIKVIDLYGAHTIFSINGGVVECRNNKIMILVESDIA